MDPAENRVLSRYLANMKVELQLADFTQCTPLWRDESYIPDYSKFYFICDGEGWLQVGGNTLFPREGQLILMPEKQEQGYKSLVGKKPFTKYWCHFRASIGQVSVFDLLEVPYVVQVQDRRFLAERFQELVDSFHSNQISGQIRAQSALLDIIAYYFDAAYMEQGGLQLSIAGTKLSQLIQYVNRNLDKEISLAELAEILHYHPNYLIKFFKKHMGITPNQYIQKMRMERAVALMADKALRIQDIAESVGYSNMNYFAKVFKKTYGCNPQRFREQNDFTKIHEE